MYWLPLPDEAIFADDEQKKEEYFLKYVESDLKRIDLTWIVNKLTADIVGEDGEFDVEEHFRRSCKSVLENYPS